MISIIIPAYNAQSFLAHTLESVLAQSTPDWELIVVDDGSADSTTQIARGFAEQDSRVRLICQENTGTAAARNRGAGEISERCDALLFLDHDDILEPDALRILRSALDVSPQACGAHGLARKINPEGQPLGEGEAAIQNLHRRKLVGGRTQIASRNEPTTAAMIVYDNLICTPGLALLRRSAIDKLGQDGQPLFDPAYAPLDDWDFWLRLARLGQLAFVDRVVLSWRRHEAAGSCDQEAMSAAELRVRQNLLAQELPADLALVARYRYAKLLATRRRRAARACRMAAGRLVLEGRPAAGAMAYAQGLREYWGYVRHSWLPKRSRIDGSQTS